MARATAALLLLGLYGCAPEPLPEPSSEPVVTETTELEVAQASDLPGLRVRAESVLGVLFNVRDLDEVSVTITLVGRRDLQDLAREVAHPSLRAFTETETTTSEAGEFRMRLFRIYLLKGLSKVETAAALAHELFHVHSVEQGGGIGASEAWREGAAMYVQVRALESWGREDLAEGLLENPDPVYGEGLRRFRTLVRDRGEGESVRLAATALDFPGGY